MGGKKGFWRRKAAAERKRSGCFRPGWEVVAAGVVQVGERFSTGAVSTLWAEPQFDPVAADKLEGKVIQNRLSQYFDLKYRPDISLYRSDRNDSVYPARYEQVTVVHTPAQQVALLPISLQNKSLKLHHP